MPETKINFTKAAIDALPLPETGKRKLYYDTRVRALAIQITSTGARSFYVYRRAGAARTPQKVRLGAYPDLSVEQARKMAEAQNAAIAAGEDPSEVRRRGREEKTFGEIFDWYLERHAKVRKRSWERDKANFENHLGQLARLKISKVTRGLVRDVHDEVRVKSGPYAANRILALISVVFSRAIAHEMVPGPNPAQGVEPFQEHSRDRRLSAEEIVRLLDAITAEPSEDMRDFILLLLYTGARRGNMLAMRWDEIDLKACIWRIPMTKNGKPQIVPLERAEVEILKRRQQKNDGSDWVFPGRSDGNTGHMAQPRHGWERILDRAKLTDLRLHDLRRTLGSWMVDTGASLPVVGQTLHHQDQATTAIYARLALDPVREAKARAHEAMRSGRRNGK